jgi:hypothetical protein
MLAKSLIFALSVGLTLCLLASRLPAQETLDPKEMQERAAKAIQLAGPGDEHKILEKMAGTWDQEIKYFMQPGQPPMIAKGSCTNTMVLGGRFLMTESKGGEPPMVVESLTFMGFDRRHMKYTMVGMDTMGTYYITAAGIYDDSTKSIVMSGEDEDPVMGHTQEYDIVTRFDGDDKYIQEIIFTDEMHTRGGDPVKLLEVVHTRVE